MGTLTSLDRNSLIRALLLGCLVGIATALTFSSSRYTVLFLVFVSFTILFYIYGLSKTKNSFLVFVCLFFILGVGLGIVRVSLKNSVSQNLETFVGKTVSLVGVIVDEPDRRDDKVRVIVRVEEIDSHKVGDVPKVLITIPVFPVLNYGDEVQFMGTLSLPKNFTGTNDREFDYVSYLSKDGIAYQMFMPKTELISTDKGSHFLALLFTIKNKFIESISSLIVEPESSLLGGLLVGAKSSLGTELKDAFTRVGLIHIVVLSGANLTIIASFIMRLFGFLPRVSRSVCGSIAVILFALATGADATVVRATIMTLIAVLGTTLHRGYSAVNALLLAGFLMVMQNPDILVFDISFQLSFLATLALIFVHPILEKKLTRIPERFGLREIISITLATQLFVTPFVLYMMGSVSVIALLTNILVVPLVPLTMLFGFVTGTLGFISYALAVPFAFISHVLLSYIISVVTLFAQLPFSFFVIPKFSIWLVIVCYIFFIWYIWKHAKRFDEEKVLDTN